MWWIKLQKSKLKHVKVTMVAVPFYFAALLRQLKVFTDQERMDKKSTGLSLAIAMFSNTFKCCMIISEW